MLYVDGVRISLINLYEPEYNYYFSSSFITVVSNTYLLKFPEILYMIAALVLLSLIDVGTNMHLPFSEVSDSDSIHCPLISWF